MAGAQTPTGIPKETQLNPGRVSAGSGSLIVIGCVSRQGDGASAAFIITDPRPKPPAQFRLQGDADLLRMHVGHTVEIGGPIAAAAGGAAGATAATPTLRVQSLTYISTTCSSQQK
jgi:hypothetical protein